MYAMKFNFIFYNFDNQISSVKFLSIKEISSRMKALYRIKYTFKQLCLMWGQSVTLTVGNTPG